MQDIGSIGDAVIGAVSLRLREQRVIDQPVHLCPAVTAGIRPIGIHTYVDVAAAQGFCQKSERTGIRLAVAASPLKDIVGIHIDPAVEVSKGPAGHIGELHHIVKAGPHFLRLAHGGIGDLRCDFFRPLQGLPLLQSAAGQLLAVVSVVGRLPFFHSFFASSFPSFWK